MTRIGWLLPPPLPHGWVWFEATERSEEEYTGLSRVELAQRLESRGGPSSVLNPPVAGRPASSRLRR